VAYFGQYPVKGAGTYHRHEAPPPDPLAPLTQYQAL